MTVSMSSNRVAPSHLTPDAGHLLTIQSFYQSGQGWLFQFDLCQVARAYAVSSLIPRPKLNVGDQFDHFQREQYGVGYQFDRFLSMTRSA